MTGSVGEDMGITVNIQSVQMLGEGETSFFRNVKTTKLLTQPVIPHAPHHQAATKRGDQYYHTFLPRLYFQTENAYSAWEKMM